MTSAVALGPVTWENGPKVPMADRAARESRDGNAAVDAQARRLMQLMECYQMGDAAAVEELVALANPILSRFYYSLTGDAALLDDLLQECWLRIHRARHSYRPGEPVLPWLFAIARHTRIDSYRKWRRTSGRESSLDSIAEPQSSDAEARIHTRIEAQGIVNLMEALPAGQREVLTLLKIGGMSVEEVAKATGATVPAVKQKAYRAYQAIRRALGAAEDKEESR